MIFSIKLTDIYPVTDYYDKKKILYILFPEGIVYDLQNQSIRTNLINSVFKTIGRLSEEIGEEKKGRIGKKPIRSSWVGPAGFEPAT